MKKGLIILMCAVILVSLAACAPQNPTWTSASGIFASGSSPVDPSAQSSETPAETSGTETQAGGAQAGQTRDNSPGSIDMKAKLEFSGQTVDGKSVDSGIFKDYKLTMINVWGTLCKPCIEEMPDIEALYQDMKSEQVNVIGFVANVLGGADASKISEEQRAADAGKILAAKGATYTNIVFGDAETDQINRQISGFPTTLFVDSQGNVTGGQISGPKSKDGYRTEIESRLNKTGK